MSAALNDQRFQPLWAEISGPTGMPSSGLNTPQLSAIGEPVPQGTRRTSTPASINELLEPEVATMMRQMTPEGSPNPSRAAVPAASTERSVVQAEDDGAGAKTDNGSVGNLTGEEPEADQTPEGPGSANVSRRLSTRAKKPFVPYQHM